MNWSCNLCLLQGPHVLRVSWVCRSVSAGQFWSEMGPMVLAVLAPWAQMCVCYWAVCCGV